jgi:hypothetical protein
LTGAEQVRRNAEVATLDILEQQGFAALIMFTDPVYDCGNFQVWIILTFDSRQVAGVFKY